MIWGAFFDPGYYLAQLPGPVGDAAAHFRASGDAAGLDPSPYFSTRYYKAQHPDWADSGAQTALDAFLAREAQGIWHSPHPLIQPQEYLALHPDVAAAGVSPVRHFVLHGDTEGRSPSQGFDALFYRRCYLRLGQTHAFRHFRAEGARAGRKPRPDPQGAEASAQAALKALAGLTNPIVFAVHDAQEAGTPILLRDLARWFAARGHAPVFVLLNGGPLTADLRRMGPVFLMAEGWDAAGLFRGLPASVPVIVNSGAAAELAHQAAQAGHRTLLLIHEMRAYLDGQGHLPQIAAAQAAGSVPVVSFARMAAELQPDLGAVRVVQAGIALPRLSLQAFRSQRARAKGRVFIGAGHADRRKGFDLFLEAAAEIATRDAQAEFVWLGALDDWAQRLADAALARGMRLALPGFVQDFPAWYASASVYLLTSRQDPGPTTLVHAVQCGLGFVGYDSDIGLRDLAAPFGVFVPPGDRAAFVAKALAATDRAGDRAASRQRRAELRALSGFETFAAAVNRLLDPAP